jgi:hypothetical protein
MLIQFTLRKMMFEETKMGRLKEGLLAGGNETAPE